MTPDVFVMNGGAVSWKSSKQDMVASASTEAEYIAASEAAKEAVWIRNFLIALGVVQGASNPMDVYCDNNGAIAQAKEPRQHHKNKHIRMCYQVMQGTHRCKHCGSIDKATSTAKAWGAPESYGH